MTIETIKARLVAKKEELGGYEVLVFYNMDGFKYLMCTKLPNWNTKTPNLEEIGYLQAREFIAGMDHWIDLSTGENIPYKYTGIYFWDFVPVNEIQTKDIMLD